jgi:tripartite-type tricarboxylate transporter receptor subunit TctC
MRQHLKRFAAALFATASFALGTSPATAQERTVRIFVGFAPGAATDLLARMVAEKMRATLNQAVIVENRPAVGGMQATLTVKTAPPDGSTLIVQPLAPMVTHPFTQEKLGYDPVKDFAPVAHLAEFHLALGIGTKVAASSVADYVALVKKDPNAGFYGVAGLGGLPHFFGLLISRAAGVDMTPVPHKGVNPALQALAGGTIPAVLVPLPDVARLSQGGQARILAVSGTKRSAGHPGVPTFREAGYDIEGTSWYAMFAPAATPRDVLARHTNAAIAAVSAADVRERLIAMGLEPTGLGASELAVIMKKDSERWGPVIRASGFKASS